MTTAALSLEMDAAGLSTPLSSVPRPSAPIPVASASKNVERHGFVQPSSYLRARSDSRTKPIDKSLSPLDQEQIEGLVGDEMF